MRKSKFAAALTNQTNGVRGQRSKLMISEAGKATFYG
jgi:hypothetical protein